MKMTWNQFIRRYFPKRVRKLTVADELENLRQIHAETVVKDNERICLLETALEKACRDRDVSNREFEQLFHIFAFHDVEVDSGGDHFDVCFIPKIVYPGTNNSFFWKRDERKLVKDTDNLAAISKMLKHFDLPAPWGWNESDGKLYCRFHSLWGFRDIGADISKAEKWLQEHVDEMVKAKYYMEALETPPAQRVGTDAPKGEVKNPNASAPY